MLKEIVRGIKPRYLIITPLKFDDKISSNTKITIKRNKVPFSWYSYQSDGNVVENFVKGMEKSLKLFKTCPKYIIKVDNDTTWNRKTLDNMYYCLEKSKDNVAYTYCGFEFSGAVNQKFPFHPFIPERLQQGNYISSNSMFKINILKKYKPITNQKYKRLLDWAYYLHLLNNGYIGQPCKGYFVADTKPSSISAGNAEEYKTIFERVKKDFIDVRGKCENLIMYDDKNF